MHIHIAKVNGVLWSGEADALNAPASQGELTVLPGHVPVITNLKKGRLSVRAAGQEVFALDIERGVLEITATSVTVLL